MYPDYFKAVMAHYQDGQRNAKLSPGLACPTLASLKAECELQFVTRFEVKDIETLSGFFKARSNQTSIGEAISTCHLDRFKSLQNFLTGKAKKTKHVNIELLAWLINFPNRPFQLGKSYDMLTKETETITRPIETETVQDIGSSAIEVDSSDCKPDIASELQVPYSQKMKRAFVKKLPVLSYRRKMASLFAITLLLALGGVLFKFNGHPVVKPDTNGAQVIDSGAGDSKPFVTSVSSDRTTLAYVRCIGSTPCRACSNCIYCNYCNSGGSCSMCAGTKKTVTQKRALQCKAITKKGKQCSRAVKGSSKYCWQHVRMSS